LLSVEIIAAETIRYLAIIEVLIAFWYSERIIEWFGQVIIMQL
jgi:hypothetical protein